MPSQMVRSGVFYVMNGSFAFLKYYLKWLNMVICRHSSGWIGLDNGLDATKEIQKALSDCKTIIWNGPSKLVAWGLDGEMW